MAPASMGPPRNPPPLNTTVLISLHEIPPCLFMGLDVSLNAYIFKFVRNAKKIPIPLKFIFLEILKSSQYYIL